MSISSIIKTQLKRRLTDSQMQVAQKYRGRLTYGHDLPKLSAAWGTDKPRYYLEHYQRHFGSLRRHDLALLEIGVGGFEDPRKGGASLRMWKAYFPRGRIFGIDIYDKSSHDERRIKTLTGSQVDEQFLRRVAEEIGPIDIVVDDGSHRNEHVIRTFEILFPLMSPAGIYAVEDLQTSYWDKGDLGGSKDLNAAHTSMNFFKRLVDGLNHEEFDLDEYTPSYFDTHIVGMHFYHNLLLVQKGLNNEGSDLEQWTRFS